MSKDIEEQLRKALRPTDPPDGFADRVMANIRRERDTSDPIWNRKRNRPASVFARWFPIALAASAVFGVGLVVHQTNEREERRGLEARRQLMEALRVTSDKLDSAYQAVNAQPSTAPENGPGV